MTPRLTVRAPKRGDMTAWVQLYRDPLVRKHFKGILERSENEWWSGLKAQKGDPEQPLSVLLTTTRGFIGQCGYLRCSKAPTEWEIYCQFHPAYWRRSFAFELCSALIEMAFKSLSASAVIGIVDPANSSSAALVRKLGFTEVGRKGVSGTWQDGHIIFAIQRQAYNNAIDSDTCSAPLRAPISARHRGR